MEDIIDTPESMEVEKQEEVADIMSDVKSDLELNPNLNEEQVASIVESMEGDIQNCVEDGYTPNDEMVSAMQQHHTSTELDNGQTHSMEI